jgi:peptide/nickel transport system substrate-binding protein
MTTASRRRRRTAAVAGLAAVVVVVSACTSAGGSQAGGQRVEGGVATIPLVGGGIPNYIFPFTPSQYAAYPNPQGFQWLMWRPLYWTGDNNNPGIDYRNSLAGPPVYSDGNRAVTIKLKPWKWSDGKVLGPANVAFFMGLEFTEKANYSPYTPGYFPDNVASVSYDNAAGTVTFRLTGPVSPAWFTGNQLTQIIPLPTAWDLTAPGKPGRCASEDLAAQKASCPAVYKYLTGQASHLASYAANPLWQVVDGPWRLTSFSSDGNVTMVPNKAYSGPVKPSISKLKMVPYTSETSAYNALRSGTTLSVGVLPVQNAPQANSQGQPSANSVPGYKLTAVYTPSVDYAWLDYHSPRLGPLFRQLYVRQALQSTVDQRLWISKALRGYAVPTHGPVPLRPATSYISAVEKANPYPFSVAAARRYLAAHGWSIPASGPAVCTHAGTGPGDCGAGIPAGEKLVIPLRYASDSAATAVISQQWQSDAARAGIELSPSSEAYQALVGTVAACRQKTAPSCTWGIGVIIGNLGTGIYPSGENLLAGGAGFNLGGYDDPVMNQLIKKATTSPSTSSLFAYEDYAARQVPYIWMPAPTWVINAVVANLRGATPFNVQVALMPENWYFVK